MDAVISALLEGLDEAYKVYVSAISDNTATRSVRKNQFGETAMQIDIRSEQAVINSLKKHNIATQIVSEEHGTFVVGSKPKYTVFLDGLDGSTVFKETGGKARAGTMVAVYEGIDPRFDQYIAGAVLEQISGRIIWAVRGKGVSIKTLTDEDVQKVTGSGANKLSPMTKIYIDEGIESYPDFSRHGDYFYNPIKRDFETNYLGSSAVYIFDFCIGAADLILEYGRKNNLEHMVSYPLAVESGGVFEYLNGSSVGSTKYSEYCSTNQGYPAIIIAASSALADDVRNYIASRD